MKTRPFPEKPYGRDEICSGLCDRLVTLAQYAAMCEATGHPPNFVWPKWDGCPALFPELFETPAGLKIHNEVPRDSALVSYGQHRRYWRACGSPDHTPFLKRLRPLAEIRRRVESAPAGFVGIHLRWTDMRSRVEPGTADAERQRLDAAAQSLIRRHFGSRFLIVGDDVERNDRIRTWLIENGQHAVAMEHARDPAAFRQTSVQDAVVDLYALAHCAIILRCGPGSFGRLASTIGGKPWAYVGFDHAGQSLWPTGQAYIERYKKEIQP